MDTIFELSKQFNINPLILIGLFLFGQAFFYGLRINSKLHKMKDDINNKKDDEIKFLKNELYHAKNELELIKSLKIQTEMFVQN